MLSKPPRVVGRQQRRDIEIDAEDVADGVRIARFSRCGADGRPGFGCASAWRSSDDSRNDTRFAVVAASGRGAPGGGIVPLRSFRTTFSSVSAECATSPRSTPWRTTSPLRSRSL
jgi:hypothetical protein